MRTDVHRVVRDWLKPNGIFIVFLGPDGAGKSSLIEKLVREMEAVFPSHRVFHWRPMFFWRRNGKAPVSNPHACPQRPVWLSLAQLIALVLDYCFGYWLVIRPLLFRSGLVVFDRYYSDLLIDPKRYRYGGPQWAIRLLGKLVPDPHLVFVLDAPETVILSRKRELPYEELQHQRHACLSAAKKLARARVLDSTQTVEELSSQAAQEIAGYLSRRYTRDYFSTSGSAQRPCDPGA